MMSNTSSRSLCRNDSLEATIQRRYKSKDNITLVFTFPLSDNRYAVAREQARSGRRLLSEDFENGQGHECLCVQVLGLQEIVRR